MNSPIGNKRFSLLTIFQSKPKYPCEKCKITVYDLGDWLEHLGHDPASDALVLNKMDTFVNEFAAPDEERLEEETYLDDSDEEGAGREG